jgi:hypothetical protein
VIRRSKDADLHALWRAEYGDEANFRAKDGGPLIAPQRAPREAG